MLFNKAKFVVFLLIFIIASGYSSSALASYKLQILNHTTFPIKVKWFCGSKHKDSDKMLWARNDTKTLAEHKCPNMGDLRFRLEYDSTVHGSRISAKFGKRFGYAKWYLFPHFNFWGDMYPNNHAGRALRETNYRAALNYSKQVLKKKKPCVMVEIDPLATLKGVPMPIAIPCVK